MTGIEMFGVVCVAAILICLAIAAWAGLRRDYWRGLFALAEIVAIVFIFLAFQNATRLIRATDNARPDYVPIVDTLWRG